MEFSVSFVLFLKKILFGSLNVFRLKDILHVLRKAESI